MRLAGEKRFAQKRYCVQGIPSDSRQGCTEIVFARNSRDTDFFFRFFFKLAIFASFARILIQTLTSEQVSLQSLLTEPRPKNFEEHRGHQPRLYTTSNAVAGRQFHLVLKRYGVTVLKPCPNRGCTKSFTMPRVIHYLRCGWPTTTRLDTKAIRCDCTKALPKPSLY